MEERRENRRNRTLKEAKIAFNNRHSTIDAIIRNISENGMKLSVETTAGIPSEFEIRMADGTYRKAKSIWVGEKELGVQFFIE
ncbi:MAG: PilZ domain-containing protein [Sphingomonadales bacterium]|nr:MAG: PilZ domain-containing protein [Sphingomonadales bacterium]